MVHGRDVERCGRGFRLQAFSLVSIGCKYTSVADRGVQCRCASLARQGVSARPLAILPILPGSIAPARAPTPRPRQALAEFRSALGACEEAFGASRVKAHERPRRAIRLRVAERRCALDCVDDTLTRVLLSRTIAGQESAGRCSERKPVAILPGSIGSIARLRGEHRPALDSRAPTRGAQRAR